MPKSDSPFFLQIYAILQTWIVIKALSLEYPLIDFPAKRNQAFMKSQLTSYRFRRIMKSANIIAKTNRKETVSVEADPYGNQHKADQRALLRTAPGT